MKKNVISGGYTPQEARNMLLIRGLEHVKSIVPHNVSRIANLSDCDDLPQFWLSATYGHNCLKQVNLRLDLRLCWECNYAICDYLYGLSPTLWFSGNVQQHYCELCGNWEDDDIPF